MRYAGKAGMTSSVAFDLEATRRGLILRQAAPRYTVSITHLPARIEIASARLTISAFDPATGAATIKLDRDLAPGILPQSEPSDDD